MKENLKIGLIIADTEEFAPVKKELIKMGAKQNKILNHEAYSYDIALENGRVFSLCAVLCGIGKVNAAAVTTALVYMGVDAVVSTGFSGSLLEGKHSPVIIGNSYVEHDFDLTGLGYKWGEKPAQERYIYPADEILVNSAKEYFIGANVGPLATGDRFVCTTEEHDRVVKEFSAAACDMETGAEASVCYFGNVRFIAIRNISDNADESATESYREVNSSPEANFFTKVLDWTLGLKDNQNLWS